MHIVRKGMHEYLWQCRQKYGKIFKVRRRVARRRAARETCGECAQQPRQQHAHTPRSCTQRMPTRRTRGAARRTRAQVYLGSSMILVVADADIARRVNYRSINRNLGRQLRLEEQDDMLAVQGLVGAR